MFDITINGSVFHYRFSGIQCCNVADILLKGVVCSFLPHADHTCLGKVNYLSSNMSLEKETFSPQNIQYMIYDNNIIIYHIVTQHFRGIWDGDHCTERSMADSKTSQTKGKETNFHKVWTKLLKFLTTWPKFCIKPQKQRSPWQRRLCRWWWQPPCPCWFLACHSLAMEAFTCSTSSMSRWVLPLHLLSNCQ